MDLPPPPPPFYPPPDHHHHRYPSNLTHHRDLHPQTFIPPPPPPRVVFQHRFPFSPPHEYDLPPPFPPHRDYSSRNPSFRDDVYFREDNHRRLFDFDMRQQQQQRFNDSDRFRDVLYRDDRRCDYVFNNDRRNEVLRRDSYYDLNDNRQGVRNEDRRMGGEFGVGRGSDRVREFYRERVDYERRMVDERRFDDRFSGRLGGRVFDDDESVVARDASNVVVRGSRKRKNTRGVDRVEVVGKVPGFNNSSKRRRGSNHRFENVSKETNCRSVGKGKGKGQGKGKGKERVDTRNEVKEGRKEREESPLQLAISFESNGLMARTILTPPSSSSAGKMNMGSLQSKGSGKVNGSLLSKVDGLNCQFDAESDGNVIGSENGKLAHKGNDLGEDVTRNGNVGELNAEGLHGVGSQPSDLCQLEETKVTSPEDHLILVTVSDSGPTEVTSVTTIAKDSLRDRKSKGGNHVGYWRARTRRLRKIMRAKKKLLLFSDLGTTNGSSKTMIGNIGSPSGSSEQATNVVVLKTDKVSDAILPSLVAVSERALVSVTKDADFECQSGKDEVVCCANEAVLDGGNTGDSPVCSKYSDDDINKCVPNSDSELNSDNISLRADREDEFMQFPFQDSIYPSSSQKPVDFSVTVLKKVEGEDCDAVAVADRSAANLDTLADSTFMSVEHKGVGSEFNNSTLDTRIEQSREGMTVLSHKNSSGEECKEAAETSTDHSPEFTRKRKACYDQIDLSTLTGKLMLKDCNSSEQVDFDLQCDRNRCEENESSSGRSSEGGSSYKNLDAGADCLSCKKKKVDSSRLTSMSVDGFHRDLGDPVQPDCRADRWKETHADSTTAINKCDTIDIDMKVDEDNRYIANMDNISGHEEKEKLLVNGHELDNIFSDRDVGCNAYSGDEQTESDSDELSCPSSPEDLLLFSDFSSPINTTVSPSLSRNDIMYGTSRTFRRAVSAERLGKATSYNGHNNRTIPSPVTFPMVQKSKFTHDKLMMSKTQASSTAFTGYPQKFNTPKTLPSTQVSKSKTWCRTGSVADTTPKFKPSLSAQVHTTKMSSPQNSYVRKGNSLTRTPSPSSAPSPGFHASSSSVYRISPSIDGLKKGQSLKTAVGAPSLPRKSSPSSVSSPGLHTSSSMVYRASPSVDGLKKGQAIKPTVDAPSLPRKPSPSSVSSPGFQTSSSMVYRASPSVDGLKKGQAIIPTVDTPSLPRKPSPSSVSSPGFHTSRSMVYRASPSVDGLKKGQAIKPTDETPSLQKKPSPSRVSSPGFLASSSMVYRASPSTDGLKNGQAIIGAPGLPRKPSVSSAISPRFHPSSSLVYRASSSIAGLSKGQAFKTTVDTPSLQRTPSPSNATSPVFHTVSSKVYRLSPSTDSLKNDQTSNNRVEGDATSVLQRKPSPSSVTSFGFNASRSSVYRLSPSSDGLGQSSNLCPLVNTSAKTESLSLDHGGKSPYSSVYSTGESSPVNLDIMYEAMKSSVVPEFRNSSDRQSGLDVGKSEKKITYVKRKSNQLVAASDSEDTSTSAIDKIRPSLSGGYYKSKKNQLLRTSLKNQSSIRNAVDVNFKFGSQVNPRESSRKRLIGKWKGFQKTFRSSKLSLVWNLHKDAQSSETRKVSERPQKVLSRLSPWKRATYRRGFMLAIGSKPNNKSSLISQKMLLSRKRGAVYTRSSHGYSLKMSKVFSVGGSGLKWSKSLEKNSKKVNEDATRAVAAAGKKKKEENITGAISSVTRSRVSRKLVPNIKPRPGERVFRVGSERYKMDPTRRTLRRITAEPSAPLPSEKNAMISYVPRRLYIGSNEYVRIGSGNQLVRDPKKRTRVLASEKVRWSLRTARLSWVKKKKYCQFFTKFGKCNKEDGKCPYIHDQTKIVVCTKFLNGSCSNRDCKLTHKVIPERMQDCSYFLKGSCSSDNCPYRHVKVDPDSPVCENFRRGYCPDGNECLKKHTYVCPAFESTGICLQASTCKLHHPKKKPEKKPAAEEKIVRGRYFDGGLVDFTDNSLDASERVLEKGKDENEGEFPDFISLDVGDDEMQQDTVMASM